MEPQARRGDGCEAHAGRATIRLGGAELVLAVGAGAGRLYCRFSPPSARVSRKVPKADLYRLNINNNNKIPFSFLHVHIWYTVGGQEASKAADPQARCRLYANLGIVKFVMSTHGATRRGPSDPPTPSGAGPQGRSPLARSTVSACIVARGAANHSSSGRHGAVPRESAARLPARRACLQHSSEHSRHFAGGRDRTLPAGAPMLQCQVTERRGRGPGQHRANRSTDRPRYRSEKMNCASVQRSVAAVIISPIGRALSAGH